MKTLSVLGSTGSIGRQTLEVVARNNASYCIELLAAHRNWQLMERQVREHKPRFAALTDKQAAVILKEKTADLPVQVLAGSDQLNNWLVDNRLDLVVAAMVGHAGLVPVVSAIEARSNIALANKEVLVMAGEIVTGLCREKKVTLLPVDSEHSAIFQCLAGQNIDEVKKIVLTASGGPFRGRSREELVDVTPRQAISHPNWSMGKKISVDSATLMNKGLELIEAHWLFDIPGDNIDVIIHPQSIIHSMVEFVDGTVLAQLGVPAMETPIQYALSWPERWPSPDSLRLNWANLSQLSFEAPDEVTFPCLKLARQALQQGGNSPTVLSVANDVAVAGFLAGNVGFLQIADVVEQTLLSVPRQQQNTLDDILAAIDQAKQAASRQLKG